jgi:hypothetical protein
LPKIQMFLIKISNSGHRFKKIFSHRSIVELKTKINHIKEKVRKDHEINN